MRCQTALMLAKIIWFMLLLPLLLRQGVQPNAFAGAVTAAAVGATDASGLPLIHISHDDLGEDYPEMQEEVHLEDFFWTGSGDGPPDYLKKVHTGISKGKDVILKTETVVATVYVDGNNEIDIPICLDCPPDDGGGTWSSVGGAGAMPPVNYSATDRRYWLLTVMSGFYTVKDNPTLEEKLARLYRLAFTRQQSRHLGFNGAQQIASIAVPTGGRERREPTSEEHLPKSTIRSDPSLDIEVLDMDVHKTPLNTQNATGKPLVKPNSELFSSSEEKDLEFSSSISTTVVSSTTDSSADAMSTTDAAYITLIPWELIQQGAHSLKLRSSAAPILQSESAPPQILLQNHPLYRQDHIRVIIHNVTQITEEQVQSGRVSTATYEEDVNDKIDDRRVANQTELIYSVLVNGRPVLAATAANDMKLVSEAEVASTMGKEIFMKAEPYLREPQATPLAPATHSGSVGFIDSIQNNTALVIVSSIAILLLLLLLVALLLVGRSRSRERKAEELRSTSRSELHVDVPTSSGTVLDTGRSTTQSRDVGIQNFSYEHDTEGARGAREARIHFPGPPLDHGSRRGSFTSTDNTSDSSVYCPINPPSTDVQRMLDEKAAGLFDRHKKRHHQHQHEHQYDRAEGLDDAVYTTVVSEKKRDKLRHKTKRRYLSENRVGSLETSPVQRAAHSSGDEVVTESVDADELRPTYTNYERNEAYNPHNNYHRNKLLHQRNIFTDGKDRPHMNADEDDELHTTEAINKEIIRALQPAERSSDTGSIGSFLSMASVKAFPKSSLPEPLNRVLEPVFVTYYDNVDNTVPVATSAKSHKSQRKLRTQHHSLDTDVKATLEGFPSPKAPIKTIRMASQSDNPDPGVVGPIVWERHKKRISAGGDADDATADLEYVGIYSPAHDPGTMRNHFEGLLEGAIQMYSSQDDLPMPLPTCDFTNKRKPTKRENRGSSAGTSSSTKMIHHEGRPATAQPEKTSKSNQSTQPPSPSSGAWGGSIHGSHSPLVRPLSAGPFHHPEKLPPPRSATNRADLSTAPLIEAIQNELRRFKQQPK